MVDRRGFFKALAGTAVGVAAAIALPELDIWTPSRTYFLPPLGGWSPHRLITGSQITQEALKILHTKLRFTHGIYSDVLIEGSQWTPAQRIAMVSIRRPPRYVGIAS
jgi:hypothetical protein